MRQYLFGPLSFGLDPDGQPNQEARVRCDRAVRLARRESDAILESDAMFVVSGGNGALAQKSSVYSLATATETYLQKSWGVAHDRILNRGRYDDTNTVIEILVLRQTTLTYRKDTKKQGDKVIARPVTSWWHAPRVWLICLIIFGKPVHVHISRTTLPWYIVLREIFFHECPGLFKSCFQAMAKKKRLMKPVKRS